VKEEGREEVVGRRDSVWGGRVGVTARRVGRLALPVVVVGEEEEEEEEEGGKEDDDEEEVVVAAVERVVVIWGRDVGAEARRGSLVERGGMMEGVMGVAEGFAAVVLISIKLLLLVGLLLLVVMVMVVVGLIMLEEVGWSTPKRRE